MVSVFFCFFGGGLTSLLNICGLVTMEPACSSGTLTNVLLHRNVMLQTQDVIPHRVTVYRHGADPPLCYPLNVTLKYTATHFNVLGQTQPGNPPRPSNTHQRTLNYICSCYGVMVLGRKYRTNRVLNPGPVVCESMTLSARPQLLPICCL